MPRWDGRAMEEPMTIAAPPSAEDLAWYGGLAGDRRPDSGARPMPAVPGVTHRFVAVRGARLHLAEAGAGDPVVLLHGFPQHWYAWRRVIPQLAGADRHAEDLALRVVPGAGHFLPDERPAEVTEAPARCSGGADPPLGNSGDHWPTPDRPGARPRGAASRPDRRGGPGRRTSPLCGPDVRPTSPCRTARTPRRRRWSRS